MASERLYYRLLTDNHIVEICTAITTNEKVRIIAGVLAHSFLVVDKSIYCFNDITVTFTLMNEGTPLEIMKWIVNDFIQSSIAYLNHTEPTFADTAVELKKLGKDFGNLCDGKGYGKDIKQFFGHLTMKDVILDNDKTGVHFRNGRFDLRSGEFIPLKSEHPFGRTAGSFITKFLDYDWVPSTPEGFKVFEDALIEIYQTQEVAEFVLTSYARALCGTSMKDQDLTINIGAGGSGKSTMFNFLIASLGHYTTSIKFTAFDNNYEFQMCFRGMPSYVKFIFVEECDKIKTISNLKMMADGKITMRNRGKNTQDFLYLKAKVFTTSNSYIYFGEETGTLRRINYLTYYSKFVPDVAMVDNANQVFLRNPLFSVEAILDWDGVMKSTFFNLLVRYCSRVWSHEIGDVSHYKPFCFSNAEGMPNFTNFARSGIVYCTGKSIPKKAMMNAVHLYFATQRITFAEKEIVSSLQKLSLVVIDNQYRDVDFSAELKGHPNYQDIVAQVVNTGLTRMFVRK